MQWLSQNARRWTKKKVENHACLVGHYRHYRLYRCISRTTTRRGINTIPKCFSCPGDCKELSKKTKRSTYDSNQARAKPWPTRSPTSDNNSPITKRIRTNETQNVSLTLATVEDCRRKQGDGTRAVVSWPYGSGLHARILPTMNSKTDKTRRHQDTSNYSKLQEKAGKVQTKANTANTSWPFFYDDVGVA